MGMPALLLFGDTERTPALRHEIPVAIGDPLLFAELDGRATVLTNHLERERLAAALPEVEIIDFFERGFKRGPRGPRGAAPGSRRPRAAGRGRRDRDRARLWDRRIGGVRFEDLLLIIDDGCETLTRYPYELRPR